VDKACCLQVVRPCSSSADNEGRRYDHRAELEGRWTPQYRWNIPLYHTFPWQL